jgi:hypothetical protein
MKMKTITIKTTFFSKEKLGARRSPEFRIFHHFTPELLGAAQGPQTLIRLLPSKTIPLIRPLPSKAIPLIKPLPFL